MDKTILEIARMHNNGSLRAVNIVRRPEEGVYFAPGINSNPLHPNSNPWNIAMKIRDGGRTDDINNGIQKFLHELWNSGILNEEVYISSVGSLNPSNEPIFIETNTGSIATWYRACDDEGYLADEFISQPDEAIAINTYRILLTECYGNANNNPHLTTETLT
jgi:hypothetical protein